MQLNKIYRGDSLELIGKVADESVDLIICDGPYGINADQWDKIPNIQEFNLKLIEIFSGKLKPGGSLYLFGKPDCVNFIDYRPFLSLKSKIIWYQPSRLAQGRINFTNNYDVICYFVKGERPAVFNLDAIRVPQLVELEHRLRCERVPSVRNGTYSGTKFNENGKNPGDVWGDIKQLTYKSHELLSRDVLHTIQKPLKLMERLVKASSNSADFVLDPFCGVGTTLAACEKLGRQYVGFEINSEYVELARKRLEQVKREKASRLFTE